MVVLKGGNTGEVNQISETSEEEEYWPKVNLQQILRNRENQKVLDGHYRQLREQRHQQRLNDMIALKQKLRAERQ